MNNHQLRKALIDLDMGAREFCRQTGVSERSMRRMLNGQQNINQYVIDCLDVMKFNNRRLV